MSQAAFTPDTQPWYKQGWPWLLIALPASAVLGGIITLVIAVHSPNALVVDDYYKQGLAINQHMRRLQTAGNLGLLGLLRSDGARLSLRLTSTAPVAAGTLKLRLIHSTRSEFDRELVLQRAADGLYRGQIGELPPGVWYLRLGPGDASWELRARINTDGAFQANLTPQA